MSEGHIHTRYRTVSASTMLKTIGDSLGQIRTDDDATYKDLAVVLGKSADRAECYARGESDMGIVSFLRGVERWDGRFANAALALVGMKVVPLESSAATDRDTLPAITGLLHEVAVALADDGKIDDRELTAMRAEILAAGRAIDMLRERLNMRLRSVS